MFGVVLSSIMLCATPTTETIDNIRAFATCLNNNDKLEHVIEWQDLVSEHSQMLGCFSFGITHGYGLKIN